MDLIKRAEVVSPMGVKMENQSTDVYVFFY